MAELVLPARPQKHMQIFSDNAGMIHLEFYTGSGRHHYVFAPNEAERMAEAVIAHVRMIRGNKSGLVTL